MQVIEIIIIAILICIQVYFCVKVMNRSKLISSILPNKNTVRVYKEFERTGEAKEDSIFENISSDELEKSLYYRMPRDMHDGTFVFLENLTALPNFATVKLDFYKSGMILFRPCCRVQTLKKIIDNVSYSAMFIVDSSNKLNDEDHVICVKPGTCKAVDGGWKIIRKSVIKM